MEQIDHQQFGQFVSQLRKERGLTQRDLAEQLNISDKAVSKWERGLNLPDISLLLPLAELLGVSAPELLKGERLPENSTFSKEDVENMMRETLRLSGEEAHTRERTRKQRQRSFLLCAVLAAAEVAFISWCGLPGWRMSPSFWTVEVLMLVFGVYFSFFVRETLPVYYDYVNLGYYQHGVLRMNMPGVHFNNRNWPHIVHGLHTVILAVLVLFPLLYLLANFLVPALWQRGELYIALAAVFSIFIPIYICGRKYE